VRVVERKGIERKVKLEDSRFKASSK